MTLEDYKTYIMVWLPVMKEIEALGHNPIHMMFEDFSIKKIEICYKAIIAAKEKYPKWYKVVGSFVVKQMKSWNLKASKESQVM